MAELQRVERDLHDGAQARLVALAMDLGLAEQRLAQADHETAMEHVAAARGQARAAMAELRDLVRGIGPSILTDRGLDAALTALVSGRTPPVDLRVELASTEVTARETAAYFVVAEALANARKHARASLVSVHVYEDTERALVAEVVDDGCGGADPEAGSGLEGLRKRIAALDGSLTRRQPGRGAHHCSCGDPMRVVICEDLALLRDGLRRLLQDNGMEVVAEVGDGDRFVSAAFGHKPDVCVVDVRLPPSFRDEGIRAALAARERVPGLPILILSQYVEQTYAAELLADGAGGIGYLLKERVADVDEFVGAVRRVAAGGTVLDPEVVAQILARRRSTAIDSLTPREREVLTLMAEGRSNQAIAEALVVTPGAVEKHVSNIFGKLELPANDEDNRRVLAVLAYLRADG